MKHTALFINGMYKSVLEKILKVQTHFPEIVMFLQPYSSRTMLVPKKVKPTMDDPMQLFFSTSADRDRVTYSAELVRWIDKRLLRRVEREIINDILKSKLYDASKKGKSVNLLFVRRLKKIPSFPVSDLNKKRGGKPIKRGRATSGGWVYVEPKYIP
jgi:hypothetical protein